MMTDLLALFGTFFVIFILLVFMMPGIVAGNHRSAHAWWILGAGFIAGALCIPVVAYVSGWIALAAWVALMTWAHFDVQAAIEAKTDGRWNGTP